MRCHLLSAASKRSDHVAGVDEIEKLGLQLAVEKIIDGQLHVGDLLCLQKRTGGIEQALVYVGAYYLAGRADPLAEDPKPAQGSAADVQGMHTGSVAELREELPPARFPQARLQLQALQLRGLVGQQVIPIHPEQYLRSCFGVKGLPTARSSSGSSRSASTTPSSRSSGKR